MKDLKLEKMTIEQKIKNEYSLIFKPERKYWIPFKQMVDYYFRAAALLRSKDIKNTHNSLKLWIRNVHKRLYLGIGTELILKAIYLKNGYIINRPKKNVKINFPDKFENIKEENLNPADTYTIDQLIRNFDKIIDLRNFDKNKFREGLNICKVFRNKEGHIAVHWHEFNSEDYRKIEYSIICLYEIGFEEKLNFHIAMKKNEQGKFEVEIR